MGRGGRSAFDLFISELVLEECGAGNPEIARRRPDLLAGISILSPNEAVLRVAESLVQGGPMPLKAEGDALQVVKRYGYELPVICTPEELMGEEEDGSES